MSRRNNVALLWWRQLFQRPASFPPLPNVINGDRIQHHTLKPQPKVCKTSAETRWEGAREKQKNANQIWETYLEVGRQREGKEEQNKQTAVGEETEARGADGLLTASLFPGPTWRDNTMLADHQCYQVCMFE